MNWKNTIKKAFSLSLTIRMTSTKLLAWALFVYMVLFTGDIPAEARAYFAITMSGIIFALHTGKNITDIYNKKKGESNAKG